MKIILFVLCSALAWGQNVHQPSAGAASPTAPSIGAALSVTDTGSANAYAVCPTGSPTLADGTLILVTTANANTGASTFAYCSGTARAIVLQDASTALSGGEITSVFQAKYQATGTPVWVLLDPVSAGGSTDAVLGKSTLTALDVGKVPVITAAGTIGPSSVAVVDLDFPLALMALVNASYTGGTIFWVQNHAELTALPAGTLKGLDGLLNIALDGNMLSAIPDLTPFTLLTDLNITNNPLVATPTFTTNTALINLKAANDFLPTAPVLTTNISIVLLWLQNNSFAAPPNVSTLVSLQDFRVGSSFLTTPPNVSTNIALQTLDVAYSPLLTTLPSLTNNTLLVSVDASESGIGVNSINQVLADLVVCCSGGAPGSHGGSAVYLNGGTNAAPTTGPPDGIAAVATLTTAGWTVTVTP